MPGETSTPDGVASEATSLIAASPSFTRWQHVSNLPTYLFTSFKQAPIYLPIYLPTSYNMPAGETSTPDGVASDATSLIADFPIH